VAAPRSKALSAPCGTWKFVPSPLFTSGTLSGVAGTSSTDVWAVGGAVPAAPIIEHWDGTTWRSVPSPHLAGTLASVDAISPTDAWAVGSASNAQPDAEHWDGTAWAIVPTAPLSSNGGLSGVSGVSTTDVWATGHYDAADGTVQPLFEHWDGTSW